MLTPPELLWRTEPGSLYTILLVNTDVEDSLQVNREHGEQNYAANKGTETKQY